MCMSFKNIIRRHIYIFITEIFYVQVPNKVKKKRKLIQLSLKRLLIYTNYTYTRIISTKKKEKTT